MRRKGPGPVMGGSRCRRPASYFWELVACFVAYVLFGAFVFSAMELPREVQLRRELEGLKAAFLRGHRCVEGRELEALLQRLVGASSSGISPTGNESHGHNWDLASSVFFVVTVLTTTGYGQSVPLTKEGKSFCMLYTLLGIPVTLLLLSALVQRLMFYVQQVPTAHLHRRWGLSPQLAARVHALALGAAVASCFFLLPAVAFMNLEEDWSYLESLYFCFISLSTIGLGDLVPGTSRYPSLRHLYRIGVSCYLIVGLIALLVVLETFYGLREVQLFMHLFVSREDQEARLGFREDEETIALSKPGPSEHR
ncbi:potassium channel subfamily K member 1-like [Pristis pectinata]|uniref:potassium channel subfamily K member 1-like n=1 Tax=Pristis pectinata TaxID=685728 RepID=UPI00223E6C84|nr:potassium channel subfamily K member 1-like [Pristis pectinata]